MSTSGSQDYEINRTQLIDSALRVLGVLYSGQSVTDDSNVQNDCVMSLNLMLKAWENKGIQLWVREQQVVSWTTNVSNVNIKTGGTVNIDTPLRIVNAYRRDSSNNDVQLTQMSRDYYDRLSNKQTTGTPVQFWYDYQANQGNLHLWPVPDANTNIVIVYHKQFDDMDSNTDTLDFPQSWMDTVKWNLAVRLAPEFGRPLSPEVIALAQNTLKEAEGGAYEEGSVMFAPSERITFHRTFGR